MNTFVDQSSPGSRLEGYPVLRCKLIPSKFVQVKERDHEITGTFNSPLRATVDPVGYIDHCGGLPSILSIFGCPTGIRLSHSFGTRSGHVAVVQLALD